MLINILLLSHGFKATNYDQSNVDTYRKILVYKLSVNLVEKKTTSLKVENEESDDNSIMEVYEVPKINVTPDYEDLMDNEKRLLNPSLMF